MTDNGEVVINMRGQKAALGPLRKDLLPLYLRWRNNFEIQWTYGNSTVPVTAEQQESWLENQDGNDIFWFTVYQLDPFRPVGITDLFEINQRWGSARFGVLIGEEDARGIGLGTEVAQLMLDFAFTALGLHNVMLSVVEYNEAGRRAYEKAGFREFGRRRGADIIGGQRYDEIFMDCIASEFQSPLLADILSPDRLRRRPAPQVVDGLD